MKDQVGYIGLGIMGQPMALNLVKAGYPLMVWNRTKSKTEPLRKAGATIADSPSKIAEKCDLIFLNLMNSEAVQEILLKDDGLLNGLSQNKIIVDNSTISPFITEKLGDMVAEKGCQWLDAPVSGGDIGAKQGNLSIMVGGSEEAFNRLKPLLEILGSKIFHMGPVGFGQKTKLGNQILGVINLSGVCETLSFAKSMGLDLNKFIKAVGGGAAGSWILDHLGPKMIQSDFNPGFTIDLQQKDLGLVFEASLSNNLPLPITSLIQQPALRKPSSGRRERRDPGSF